MPLASEQASWKERSVSSSQLPHDREPSDRPTIQHPRGDAQAGAGLWPVAAVVASLGLLLLGLAALRGGLGASAPELPPGQPVPAPVRGGGDSAGVEAPPPNPEPGGDARGADASTEVGGRERGPPCSWPRP